MRPQRRVAPPRLTWAAACAGGAATLAAAAAGGAFAALANTATVAVLGWLLMRGGRLHDALRRSRLLLLAALATAFASGLMGIGYQLVEGRMPPHPWFSDGVSLAYVPFVVGGLLLIPAGSRRVGHRSRSLADGAVAATSLWYLLLTLGVQHGIVSGSGLWGSVVAFGYPVGDVFVVSTALATLARCAPAARPLVSWLVAGLSLVAMNDLWAIAPHHPGGATVPAVLFQLGLLALAGAGTPPPVRQADLAEATPRAAWVFAVLPFAPLLGCMALTSRMVLRGDDMPHELVLPALAVALALMVRQVNGSRDLQRLVLRLRERERGLEAELRKDALTGLTNRVGFAEFLDQALTDPAAWPVTLALLDLNDFKLINDNHGHVVGDVVLKAVAGRLTAALRHTDVVARLGGDEFAIVTTGMGSPSREQLGERLVRALDEPVVVGGRRFTVTTSVGIVSGQPPETAHELLAHADAAMYQAKSMRQGESRVAALTADGRLQTARELRIREEIAAPDLAQFHVLYQPVVDLETGRIRGIEALLRWRHPTYGLVSPEVFIPLAEQAGTIGVLGEAVLRQAIADLARLRSLRPDHRLAVGVNVSPRQFDEHFVDHVLDLVARHDIDGSQVVLEITEQAFETDLGPVAQSLLDLTAGQVSVAVDDFGTGYSSLRYLQRLPLDVMKIDRTFVADIASSRSSRQLVNAVATMGATLGLQLVAEGIENLDQLRLLQSMRCELGQGFLFSQPVPIAEIEQLIRSGHVYAVGGVDGRAPVPAPRTPLVAVAPLGSAPPLPRAVPQHRSFPLAAVPPLGDAPPAEDPAGGADDTVPMPSALPRR